MSKPLLILAVLGFLLAPALGGQKPTKKNQVAGRTATAEVEYAEVKASVERMDERVTQAKADLLSASREYKASLEKLLPFEEDERKKAADQVELRKQLLAEGAVDIKKRDVEDSERKLAAAEFRIGSTRKQLSEAGASIEAQNKELAEALDPEAKSRRQAASIKRILAERARQRQMSTKRSKARTPAQKQKLPPYIKVAKCLRLKSLQSFSRSLGYFLDRRLDLNSRRFQKNG